MILAEAAAAARQLMDFYDLGEWSFGFDRAKRRCGNTNFGTTTITLSRYYVELNGPDLVMDTIRHEIAHVLAGPAAGHGPLWKKYAVHVGARPCARKSAVMPPGDWHGRCDCGYPHRMHRKPKRAWHCNTCRTLIAWVRITS